MKRPESAFQRQTADYLRVALRPGVIAFHVPNERSSAIQTKILAGQGVLAGVADWIFLAESRAYCIELKTETGRQTEAQKRFEERCEQAEIPYRLVRTFEEFDDALAEWGLLTDARMLGLRRERA